MTGNRTDYEQFEASSVENRRLLREEELILETTIALCGAMKRDGVNRAELAERLGRTRGFVSQLLSGGRNLTLRTLADVADALESRVSIEIRPNIATSSEMRWQSFVRQGTACRLLGMSFTPVDKRQTEIPLPNPPVRIPDNGLAMAS